MYLPNCYEEALLADLYPAPCPFCGRGWACGQDVRERKAVLHRGVLVCLRCVSPCATTLVDWAAANLAESPNPEDRLLAQRVQGLDDTDIEVNDMIRLLDLMEA